MVRRGNSNNNDVDGNEKDRSICNMLMYTLFPTSSIGMQYEIKKIGQDIDKLHEELGKEREKFAINMRMYRKLQNKSIPMDPNGMSRADAIKKVVVILNTTKENIQNQETLINTYTKAKNALESTSRNADMEQSVRALNQRIRRVKPSDAEKIVKDLDEIAEKNKDMDDVNERIHDAMISGLQIDMDMQEIELEEFMATFDEEDLEIGHKTNEDEHEELQNLIVSDYEEDNDKIIKKPEPAVKKQAHTKKTPELTALF